MGRNRIILCAIFLFGHVHSWVLAQDSSRPSAKGDTAQFVKNLPDPVTLDFGDSVSARILVTNLNRFPVGDTPTVYGRQSGSYMLEHPYFKAIGKSVIQPSLVRKAPDTDWIFYLFMVCLLYLALIRMAFPKYFHDLFRVFFNSSLRQKQIREQLVQDPLPSLMLNIFFIFSGGAFIYFLARHYHYTKGYNTWLALGFCIVLLAAVYLVKFLILRFMGWIFGKPYDAETYAFIVFMINKISGLVLFPLAVMLAFASREQAQTVITMGILLIFILLIYRLIRSYSVIHKSLRINPLHFILFVFAFEAMPIMLLVKVLNNFF